MWCAAKCQRTSRQGITKCQGYTDTEAHARALLLTSHHGCRLRCMKLLEALPIPYPYWICKCTACTGMGCKQMRVICMEWITSVTLCRLHPTKLNMVMVMALSTWPLFKPVPSKIWFCSNCLLSHADGLSIFNHVLGLLCMLCMML